LSLPEVSFLESRGSVVRDCPGTQHHVCCGYKTIDLIEGCVLSCSYCILRDYLNHPGIRITRQFDTIVSQLDDAIKGAGHHVLRFGTGELSDSLALDRKYRLNGPLIEYFGAKGRALLELKSKWASVDHLLPQLNPFTVVSFSLAPQRIIDREEKRTSPLYKRLKAARKVQRAGSFVGLHFDPVIIYDGFEKDYEYLIGDLSRILDLDKVIWVSLGLLRFPANLYYRFLEEGRTNLLAGEFVRGEDGKYRYIKTERTRVYSMLYNMLKAANPDLFVYLCMERSDIWERVTGSRLDENKDLIRLFDARIEKLYGGVL
jgi:spore photoproduct lyase